MGEFTPIETQEAFDNAIKSRLERERNKFAEQLAELDNIKQQLADSQKQVGDLSSALDKANEKITGFDSQIAERDAKIKGYELHSAKTAIAHEYGLSYDAIDFLQGDDEEAIKKSAESLKNLVGSNRNSAPLASSEPIITDDTKKNAALKGMLKDLNL